MPDGFDIPAAIPVAVGAEYNTLQLIGDTLPDPPLDVPPPVTVPPFPGVIETLLVLIKEGLVRRPKAMPEQILGLRDQQHDNNGEPLAGGSVDVFAAGTTTRVTTYSDSDLTQENANPVPLNGSGRANVWVSRPVDIRVLDSAGSLVAEELELNPSNIGGGFNSGLIPNGSFETDGDANDVPDGWLSENNAAGSNNGLETGAGNTGAGGQSWRSQSTGIGGGELVTANAFEVNDFESLRVSFLLRSTVAAVRNIVRVEWYDVTDTLISSSDLYDSVANPAAFTQEHLIATPPSGARLARLRILGGTAGGTLAGITYWDNFRVVYPEPVLGVFDNVTIQGNEIITTNTNGQLDITPNGSGALNLGGGSVVVSPPASFGSTVAITGALTGTTAGFSGALTADTVATVAGLTAGGDLSVVGNSSLTGTLGVVGVATFTDVLMVNGVGTSTFVGPVTSLSFITGSALTTAGVASVGSLLVTTNQLVDLADDVASVRIGPAAAPHMEMDVSNIQAKANTNVATTLNLNRLGGPVIVGVQAANSAEIQLRNQRTRVRGSELLSFGLLNAADGAPAFGAAQQIGMTFLRSDGLQVGRIGYINDTSFCFEAFNDGGGIALRAEDSSNVLQDVLTSDPTNRTVTLGGRATASQGFQYQTTEVTVSATVTATQAGRHYFMDTGALTALLTIEVGFQAGDVLILSYISGTQLGYVFGTGTRVNGTLNPVQANITALMSHVLINIGNNEWIAREWPNI